MSKAIRWTPQQLEAYQRKASGGRPAMAPVTAPATRQKYGNEKAQVEGETFDSRAEAGRWQQLLMLERAGLITDLQRQVPFELAPSVRIDGKTKPAIRYFADAVYIENGKQVVEDTKSAATRKNPVYRLKKHLMMAFMGIEIKEFTK